MSQTNDFPRPPQGSASTAPRANIPNYLVQAILVTIFCCLPFGIVAIVFAAQVNGKIQAGDIAGAQDSSSKAKMWCWLAFGLGLVAIVISIIMNVGVFMATLRTQGGM